MTEKEAMVQIAKEGFLVIESHPKEGDPNCEIILVRLFAEHSSKYATWIWNKEFSLQRGRSHGHYFNDITDAAIDFKERT